MKRNTPNYGTTHGPRGVDPATLGQLAGNTASTAGVADRAARAARPRRKGKSKKTPATGNVGKVGQAIGAQLSQQLGAHAGTLAGTAGANAVANAPANPYDLRAPRTPEQVQKLINAEARLKFGDELSSLKTQQARVPQYFTDYRARLDAIAKGLTGDPAAGKLGGVYGNAVNTVGAYNQQQANGTANAITAANSQTPVPGAQANPNVTGDAALAAGVRAQGNADFAGLIASHGATENAYLQNQSAASGPLQIQALLDVANQIANTKKDKGAFKETALHDLKAEDLARLVAISGIKLDKAAASFAKKKENDTVKTTLAGQQSTAANAAAGRAATARNARKARRAAARNAKDARDNAIVPDSGGLTHLEWMGLTPARRAAITKQQKALDHAPKAPTAAKVKNQKDIKDIKAQIRHDRDDPTAVPIFNKGPYTSANPKTQIGTRKPTPAELNAQLRKKYTQRQIDKAQGQMVANNPILKPGNTVNGKVDPTGVQGGTNSG